MNALAATALPRVLPADVRLLVEVEDGAKYLRADGMTVIASVSPEADGKTWLHVSCAHLDRMPSYEDLAWMKRVFVGPNRAAVMVLPEASKHINIHSNCLHLFSCLNGHPLPDFTRGGTSL